MLTIGLNPRMGSDLGLKEVLCMVCLAVRNYLLEDHNYVPALN